MVLAAALATTGCARNVAPAIKYDAENVRQIRDAIEEQYGK
jgi:hypothetical protein